MGVAVGVSVGVGVNVGGGNVGAMVGSAVGRRVFVAVASGAPPTLGGVQVGSMKPMGCVSVMVGTAAATRVGVGMLLRLFTLMPSRSAIGQKARCCEGQNNENDDPQRHQDDKNS